MNENKIKKSWRIPSITKAETIAIQALNKGNANESQQALALKCIIEKMCGYYDEPFHPESERFTNLYLGRRNVAAQIMKEIAMPISKLSEREENKK